VPLVSLHAAPGTLTSAVWVWRVSSVVGEAGKALAGYAHRDGTRAYLLYDSSSMGVAEAEAFRGAFTELGGVIIGESQGTSSLSNRLQSARFDGATTIFAAYSDADAAAVLDAYRTSGLTIKLLGPGMLTETVDLSTITLPSHVFTSSFYAYDLDNDPNTRFVSGYNQKHHTQPTAYAMAAYDGASVLHKALGIANGSTTGSDLNQAFSQLGQLDSPRGTWTFNINRSPQQKWYLRQLGLDGQVPGNLLSADLQVLG
jgi:branched-chain amino acid transport system substrate-binding protein